MNKDTLEQPLNLNFEHHGSGQAVILLHGLFGSLSNLGVLARKLKENYSVYQIDLRNHGQSPWADEMNYDLMAKDIIHFIENKELDDVILIGHSMGGKTAMRVAHYIPNKIEHLIVLDIAPIVYQTDQHQKVLEGLKTCQAKQLTDRTEVYQTLIETISEPVVQFLMKSFKESQWIFNFNALYNHYRDICDWQEQAPFMKPTLFLKGQNSDYILNDYTMEIITQFPYSTIKEIPNSGHNVHFEQPHLVINSILESLT